MPDTLESAVTRRWQALNPAIYLISVLPGLTVVLMAEQETLWFDGLALATFAVVLLQHAINVFNDLSDWRLGADVNKMDSWVRFHQRNLTAVAMHGTVSMVAGSALGLYVLHVSERYWILAIAAPLLVLGYLYNSGKKPLSYSQAGEWVTAICYGPGVFGCLWLVAGQDVGPLYLLGSAAFAALSLSLLLSHQPPQIETDRQAGKLSFAVRHGRGKTIRVARRLLVVSSLCVALGLSLQSAGYQVLAIYLCLSAAVVALIYRVDPQPKIIMLGSSLSIASALALATATA